MTARGMGRRILFLHLVAVVIAAAATLTAFESDNKRPIAVIAVVAVVAAVAAVATAATATAISTTSKSDNNRLAATIVATSSAVTLLSEVWPCLCISVYKSRQRV